MPKRHTKLKPPRRGIFDMKTVGMAIDLAGLSPLQLGAASAVTADEPGGATRGTHRRPCTPPQRAWPRC